MQINKVHHVITIERVAKELGENEECLANIANEMEPEDGLIWVCGLNDNDVMAFTEFGIKSLRELIAIHRDSPK